MDPATPPVYAWDWFTRQRLLWQEARARLVDGSTPSYTELETRPEVVARLRQDYPVVPEVRRVVDEVVREIAFLDRMGRPFEQVASSTAPRGLRWWWSHLSGAEVAPPPPRQPARGAIPETQLTLGEVLTGYGDELRPTPRSGTSSRNRHPGSSDA